MSGVQKSIFQEDWWLDITTSQQWGRVEHKTKYGRVLMDYACRKRFGLFNEIYLPALTPYMGMYTESNTELSTADTCKMIAEAAPELLKKLPWHFRMKTNFLPSFDWWSPLYWEGLKQHTRYTSVLDNIADHDAVFRGFNSNIKRNIKRAKKKVSIVRSYDGEKLYELFEKTMVDQGRKPGYSKHILLRLCDELEARQCGIVLTAEDSEGQAHSGLLLVWDDTTAYYLVGGTDPSLRDSGAMSLTMWEAIQIASGKVSVFDFEGSMQKGIDRFIRGFGARPVPYYNISNGLLSAKVV